MKFRDPVCVYFRPPTHVSIDVDFLHHAHVSFVFVCLFVVLIDLAPGLREFVRCQRRWPLRRTRIHANDERS
jgi:hypothetical protein